MEAPIKILLADDHPLFMEGIEALLSSEKHFAFVGKVEDGQAAIDFIEQHPIDILISDISMPGMTGVELVRTIKQQWPQIKVLVISMHHEKHIIAEVMLAEAEGYILKNAPKQELTKAINEIAGGGLHYSQEVMQVMLAKIKKTAVQEEATKTLSQRELEVIKLIVQEKTTMEIADLLHISHRTVDTHRKHIMEKTNSKTIIGFMKFAFRNGLVS